MKTAASTNRQDGSLASSVMDGTLRCRVSGGLVLRFAPTALDAEVLTVVEAAVTSHVALGLVLPLAGNAVPMLVGAASVVGAIRRTGSLGVEAALVASNLASRVLYDRLYFGKQRLADFVPRSAIDVDGESRVIGTPARDGGGRLHVVSRLERLRGIESRLTALVIDASTVSPAELNVLLQRAGQDCSIVCITTNPFDPSLDTIRSVGGVVWGWPAHRVTELAMEAVPTPKLSAGPLVADRAVLAASGHCATEIVVSADKQSAQLDRALADAWRALSSLAGAVPSGSSAAARPPEALWWAWGVFNTLSLLPIPPARYDEWVGSSPYMIRLRDAPELAVSFARNSTSNQSDSWFRLAEAFAEALRAAASGARLAEVVTWLAEIAESGRTGVLVMRNRAAANATREVLDESPHTPTEWSNSVHLVTLSELVAGRDLPVTPAALCVPGPIPRSRAGILALPPGSDLRVVAAGEFEARRIAAQASSARQAMQELGLESASTSARRLGMRSSHNADSPPLVDPIRLISAQTDGVGDRERLDWRPTDNSPWEPFEPDLMVTLRQSVDSGMLPRDEAATVSTIRSSDRTETAEVIVIEVDHVPGDRGSLVIGPNDLITRRRGTDAFERVAAKSLRPGDDILLVDHGARRDLLGTLIERLAETPEYSALQYLVDFWKTRAARAARSGLTQREILGRMSGTRITNQGTVGNWIRGVVDGPRDNADVARFARALGDDVLLAEAKRIGWALDTIHKLHRRVGGWLSRRLSNVGAHEEHLIIGREERIYVADLTEAITVHEVVAVDRMPRRSPTLLVGTLVGSDELHLLRAA